MLDPDLDVIKKEMEKRTIKTKEEYDKMMEEPREYFKKLQYEQDDEN